MRIDGWARTFLQRPGYFATLGTLARDGSPMAAVIWYTLRDDAVVVNSAVGRAWPSNLLRDPRCSFSIEDGYEWLGLRCHAVPVTDQAAAQADIAAMARRYHAGDDAAMERLIHDFRQQQRISFLLRPVAVYEHPDE